MLWCLERPWLVWLVLFPIALAYTLPFLWSTDDVFEMAAAIRAAAENLAQPANPLLALPGETSPRFTPYCIFWAAVTRVSGASPLLIIQITAFANFLLFASGLTRFSFALFGDRKLATILVPVMLFCWGKGYGQANAYHLDVFFVALPYAAMFAYGAGFHALAELVAYLRTRRSSRLILYAIFSAFVFLSHPITGLFVFVVAGVLALFNGPFKRAALLQAVPLLALLSSFAWPYFSYADTLLFGTQEQWYEPEMFGNQLGALGIALAGVPLAGWFAYQRRHLAIVALLAICGAIYLLSWALTIFIGERFLLFAAFAMHLLIALFIFDYVNDWINGKPVFKGAQLFRLALILVMLLTGVRWRGWDIKRAGSLIASAVGVQPYAETSRERYRFLEEHLDSADIVLADGQTGWPVPALTGARLVYHWHGNPLLNDELADRRAVTDGFLLDTQTAEQREDLRVRWGATHVLIDLRRPESFAPSVISELEQESALVAKQHDLALFRIR